MAEHGLTVLVVDADPGFRDRIRIMLAEASHTSVRYREAADMGAAAGVMAEGPVHLCLIDISPARPGAMQAFERLQADFAETAFVFLAEQARKDWCYAALHSGAMDYLVKSDIDPFGLVKSIAFSLFRKNRESSLKASALRDHLTGLGNRALFAEQAEVLFRQAQRTNERIGILFMDVDGLKPVNDTYGHEAGDTVLRMVSSRIVDRLRKGDIVSRMGGDEFAALLPRVDGPGIVAQVADDLHEIVGRPCRVGTHNVKVGLSCGSALFPDDSTNYDELLRMADRRMYEDKVKKKDKKGQTPIREISWLTPPSGRA